MKRIFADIIILTVVIFSLSGCAAGGKSYYSDKVIGDLADREVDLPQVSRISPELTPVIFIHGLLGARLRDSAAQCNVWGDFCFTDMLDSSFYDHLAVPMGAFAEKSAVGPEGLLEHSNITFCGIKTIFDNYSHVINLFRAMGYRTECTVNSECNDHCTFFVFYYDWRKGVDENAALLAEFIENKQRSIRECRRKSGKETSENIRFDLVGHSMGGLIARYYAQYGGTALGGRGSALPEISWQGAKNLRKIVMVATPNGGYVDTLLEMVNGLSLYGGFPDFPGGVLCSFMSYFHMLPDSPGRVRFARSGENVDIFDISVWKKYQWGILADSAANRRLLKKMYPGTDEKQAEEYAADYLDHALDQGGRFKIAMAKATGLPPEPLRFYMIASAGFKTNAVLSVDDDNGKVSAAVQTAGDGKVPLSSAVFDSWEKSSPVFWHDVFVIDGGHMGIMRSALFAHNLARILRSE